MSVASHAPRLVTALLLPWVTIPAMADCPWRSEFVDPSVAPLPASAFKGVDRSMTLTEIIDKLGPAARQVGSGLYVLEWIASDGRVFHVSTPSACAKPIAIGFSRLPASKQLDASAALLASDSPSPTRATLTVVPEPNRDRAGAGINGVGKPGQFPPRQVIYIEEGYRTVWYACPGFVYTDWGPSLSYRFHAGKSYQLDCKDLGAGTIVPAPADK